MKPLFTVIGLLCVTLAPAAWAQPCGPDSNCVFLTKDTWVATNLDGLAGADKKCEMAAHAAGLPGTYKAWLSDHATPAASRLDHSASPYKLTDGKLVARNWADLTDGSLNVAIHLSEIGTEPNTGRQVWTNTQPNGSIVDARATRVCDDWKGNPPFRATLGNRSKVDSGWTQSDTDPCTGNNHLYCIQQGPAPAIHQIVRVNNATAAPMKFSYYSLSGQKWEALAPNTYSDADVARGPSGNFLIKVVSEGSTNASNTHLATPPANPAHEVVLVSNATAARITVSFYSPGGQKWEALEPNAERSVDVAKGPAGHLLLQLVPNK